MARKQSKARTIQAVPAVSRRTQNVLDALDLTHDTRDQLSMLTTLLHTDDGVLVMDDSAVRGLIRWLSLIDDNLLYIATRIDPNIDPDDPAAAYASAA
ncbi:hypothetical protein ACYCFK_08970 [Stutzerimonas stutzeri]